MSAGGVICKTFIGLLISDILNVLKTIREFYKFKYKMVFILTVHHTRLSVSKITTIAYDAIPIIRGKHSLEDLLTYSMGHSPS